MIIDIHSHIKRNYDHPETEEKELLADMKRNKVDFRVVSTLEGLSIEEGISTYPNWFPGIRTVWQDVP